jgi:hypothetical protein
MQEKEIIQEVQPLMVQAIILCLDLRKFPCIV